MKQEERERIIKLLDLLGAELHGVNAIRLLMFERRWGKLNLN